jgi:trehalose 6-phosphate phosphatase
LDVDGTLLDIKPRPSDVVADAALRKLLNGVQSVAQGALALVSGRSIRDLDRIFAPLVFAAAGLHGAELRLADGSWRSLSDEIIAEARPQVRDFVAAHPGLLLEDTGATLAIHFRQRPDLAQAVFDFLSTCAAKLGHAVQQGKMVVELKPTGVDKGTAMAMLMAEVPFRSRRPVFIGDDLTDEHGFQFVNSLGGLTIRVGDDESASEAHYRVRDPAQVRAHLSALLAPAGSDFALQ